MNSPCKGCTEPKRHLGCHDHCPEYQKVKAEDWELKKKIRQETKGDYELTKLRAEKYTKRLRKFGNDIW